MENEIKMAVVEMDPVVESKGNSLIGTGIVALAVAGVAAAGFAIVKLVKKVAAKKAEKEELEDEIPSNPDDIDFDDPE